ncbi:Transcription-repair-coupling factor [Candidatus Mikella endobia]|uniref:Transcription-repair-coupling factor n=1 Tax=Candidatus Mikella endobia TaxID=1778264 RepID=A0A143WPS2_9ENTR|nr:Transcription-repair-coupling factor [Candidatus Mikella endobia]
MNTDNIFNVNQLHEGQLIVHMEHGVGRYDGMTIIETRGIKAEYVILTYADNDKLYVPVYSLHLISNYDGCIDNVPLHKLGSDVWKRVRKKAVDKVRDVASELLDIYAQRTIKNGFSFSYNKKKYQLFCKQFPFELTSDQCKVINEVLSDMCKPIAMDRLICGDVGFGKTEIAMRAAFLAIENHKQVAVLVPTTLLAQQHFDNFIERFANFPVHIEMISRFRSTKNRNQVLDHTAQGKVNILIGTHILLQNKVKWHNLGLLILDEEHRFGVLHKEHIKSIYSNIDILTLTATPIPRTLNMAMSGIRNLSIISKPPAKRLRIKTFLCEYNALLVRKAILREVQRGGQVYYLYNNVKNIEKTARRLANLVPEARINIGHGKLKDRDLEKVMNDFYHQRFNVLVCTTIIETGIHIANANTIIIEQANQFGLAQLHQLRGRVGRSHHQAYAYLLTSSPKELLSNDIHKRLEAISSLEELGAGFTLAKHDLEIRGSGELLGSNQSGQMKTIGFTLYTKLLKNAIEAIKYGSELSLEKITSITDIELHLPAILPEEYIPDVNTRLSFYKRLASVENYCEIEILKKELISRFGVMPNEAHYLLMITVIRQRAQNLGIQRIEGSNKGGAINFSNNHYIDHTYIINLLKQEPKIYRFDGQNKLKFICDLSNFRTRLQYIADLLEKFQQHTIKN